MNCYLFDTPIYFLYYPNYQELEGFSLLYYSHIPTAIVALLIGLFLFINNRNALLNKLLLLISLCFSGWVLVSLISWTNVNADFILFVWPLFAIFQALISILCIYFAYVFLNKKDVSVKIKSVFAALLVPVLLFSHTNLSVSGFDITWCDAFGYEGLPYKLYYNFLGVLAIAWVFALLLKGYRKAEPSFKKQILLMGAGIEFFLFTFFSTTFVVTYLAGLGVFTDSGYEMYGLFGMSVFMIFISVLVVKHKTFNVGALASQALLLALIILVSSQFTYATSITATILTSLTLVLTALVGIILLRSVNKEVKQRIELEKLTQELALANGKLKELDKLKSEFVSIASHQLRSPLTAIRGYASLLTDGSYGKLPKKAMGALERISESSKNMAYSIEDYLNVSRIESGNMKYNYSDFNLRDETERITDDLRPQAIKKGLVILFRTDLKSKGVVHADIGKTVQIIQNLINNSIKYTTEGSIKVLVRDDVVKKRIFIDIEDTGIGMSEKSLASIFGKFERASNANTVNATGTGLGLYVAHMMAQAMGGDIKAYSEGDCKGSRFTFEMPLAM